MFGSVSRPQLYTAPHQVARAHAELITSRDYPELVNSKRLLPQEDSGTARTAKRGRDCRRHGTPSDPRSFVNRESRNFTEFSLGAQNPKDFGLLSNVFPKGFIQCNSNFNRKCGRIFGSPHGQHIQRNAGRLEFKIGFLQSRMGIVPSWGGANFLASIVGRGTALRLMTTAPIIAAPEALELGFVDMLYNSDEEFEVCCLWHPIALIIVRESVLSRI